MPAVFPNSVRVYTAKADLVDTVLAEHVNLLQDEVTAVQNTLGTSLLASAWSGTFSTLSTHTSVSARLANIEAGILSRAPLASPSFSGTPTAPTPTTTDSSTKIATTAWVNSQGYVKGDGSVSNAATATKLATARTITLTGAVAGSTTFDGSANVTINTVSQQEDSYVSALFLGGI